MIVSLEFVHTDSHHDLEKNVTLYLWSMDNCRHEFSIIAIAFIKSAHCTCTLSVNQQSFF